MIVSFAPFLWCFSAPTSCSRCWNAPTCLKRCWPSQWLWSSLLLLIAALGNLSAFDLSGAPRPVQQRKQNKAFAWREKYLCKGKTDIWRQHSLKPRTLNTSYSGIAVLFWDDSNLIPESDFQFGFFFQLEVIYHLVKGNQTFIFSPTKETNR